MDEQERQKKLEAGKAKLAQFRQRKAYSDGQHAFKKQKKKKKISKVKDEELIQEGLDINQLQTEEASLHSFQRGAAATTESVTVRTLHSDEMIKHDQTYTTELESEISTPADDYSSEEEELEFGEKYTDHEVQNTVTELEMMKNELAGKQQEIEELNKELEEMRAAYGTDGLQQLQEFETAIKKRDNIITQLTANLQQARMEKDETMREFLELTEQSQKLQIQFQHLQASETLRNTSHSSTAADLLQARQQIFAYQQQLEEQEQLLRNYQKKNEDFEVQVSLLQHKIMDMVYEEDCSTKKKMHEQQTTIEQLEAKCIEHEENIFLYLKKLSVAEKSLQELKEENFRKNQELGNVKLELTTSKQKERQCSDEIKQLMGTVEELQKRFHKDNQYENDIKEKMELEAQRKLADLRAELEEMHGQQIVQLKQELIREHSAEIEKLLAQQKADLENVRSVKIKEDQMHLMNTAINELNQMVQDANYQKEKVKQELSKQVELLSLEKSSFQNQVEDLCQELSFAREQIQRVKKTLNEKESKLQEVDTLKISIGDLKAQLASASEIRKELEMKHEAEITNYKIKLEMLEKEKDAVLDRMAESQEAELERLRTQLLFSHEEELSKMKDDLQIGHKINIENLKDNMTVQAKQQLVDLQNEMNKKIEAMQFENDNLVKNQNQLTLEIARLKDLPPPTVNTNSEEMMLLVNNLQKEIEVLRQEEKKKCILEQEIQELQLKTELLEKQMKEQAHCLQEKYLLVEAQNNVLEGENKALQDKLNKCTIRNVEGNLILTSNNSNSEDFDLQNRIDKLIAENEKLVQQDIKQKEEIDTLKNSFSLAEINFNHNYQELQENYTSLLKVKLDLEESKGKKEAEYKTKLQTSMEKIQHLQGDFPVGLETQSTIVHSKRQKVLKDFGEVIEKDTTELMEKLELAQHENLELSLRLSDISEQLKAKHHQICQLNEEIMCLKQDKEHISTRCKELELVVSHKLKENMNSFAQETENCSGEPGNFVSDFNQKFDRSIGEKEEKLIPSELLAHSVPSDLKLQMEAQRICLFVVYSAHLNQVREYLENEKENALSALKEELQLHHTQELCELKENQIVDNQKTGTWINQQEIIFRILNIILTYSLLVFLLSKLVFVIYSFIGITVKSVSQEEVENLKFQLEEQHAQEIEHLRSYFHQQLKETEEKYFIEIVHLQNRLQIASESSENSSIVTSTQILSYEDHLEDMRQELVRQYQEHQQTTEILKQSHMQQMERQKENQELLLTELDSLKIQLAENINENAITEREQMLLDELESLKKQLIVGKEKQLSELKNSSTQTQVVLICCSEVEDREEQHEQTSLDILSKERCTLQKASSRLMKILLDIVKTTAAVEETIGHLVVKLLDESPKSQFLFKSLAWEARAEDTIKPSIYVGYEPVHTAVKPSSQYIGNDLESQDNIMWSEIADEEFELTQFLGMEIDAKNEELILNINSRLQAVFEKLLQTINETADQLEHAKATQTELMQESFKWEHEATDLTKCQEELQERFDEEVRAREQIALELSKAENLIDGYADEKSLMEKQIQEKTEVIEHLEQELLRTGNKLQELEAERQHLQEEKELLFRQKDAMKADAGPIEQQLLAETEKLMKEKIEVQRQAEKEYNYLQKQVKALETDIEEQVNQFLELEQEKNAELMDLRQQNQALEKQLEKTKKFLDEQAIDREHERDVFQQEIQKLEQQLKIPQRFQPVSEHQNREVEELTNHLQEKTDKCSELLLSKEQLQRDVQERNEEIEKLECRIQELEQALMISADNIQKVEGRKKFGSATIRGDLPLEAQLQAEQEAVDRKEKEIINLEEQLEQFREELENKNEEVQQLQMQLQIQLKESTTRQQELEQENKLFKEDMKQLGQAIQNPEDTSIKGHHQVPGKYIQIIQEKEQKIHELHEQISKFQQQMEITTDNKLVEQKNEHIKELEAQIEILKSDQERVKQNNEQEIEQLNEVIEKLQQEMVNIEHKIPLDFSLTQDDVDNLKHQLDVVMAEKEDLVIQMENNVKQLCIAKNELEGKQINIIKLEKALDILKEELEKIREKPEQNINICQQQDAQISTKIEEDACRTSINLQVLEKALEEKDLELIQCNKHFKDFKDQAHMASNKLKQRIMELEEALEQKEQKIAATFQHQAELNVVLEQSQLSPLVTAVSEDIKEEALCIPLEKANYIGREDATTKLLELLEKLSEMQSQLEDAQNNLELERTKLEIVQKEAKEKEERLVELEQLLKEIEQRHKKEKLSSSKEKMQTQVVTEMDENKQGNYLELEKVKVESAAAKEELNNYKEKAEKLKEQLLVKETNLICLKDELEQTRDKLAHAEEKIAGYIKKEENIMKPEQLNAKRINASSQTEKAQQISSCNQTSQILVKSEGIQIDFQNEYSSAEVTELIKEFNEKIEQMQELHAAEIMDMETRHISESEVLKREQFIAVQELTEECNTLKNVIDVLRNKEVRNPGYSTIYSASDWNQGTYLTPSHGSETISDAVGEEGETTMDFLPQKIKGLLKAIHHEGIQVLSLTEFPYNEGELPVKQELLVPWLEERKAFLSSISSLKDLIAKMQTHRETKFYVASESSDYVSDWRAELLYAVQQIFQKEKNILLAAFRTELAEVGVQDALGLIDQLERRLQEQASYQRSALDFLQNADRQSLLMEINILHAQLNRQGEEKEEIEIHPKCQELLGYNMEMQIELRNTKDRTAELQEQLSSERMMVAELKNELEQTKLELETTLKAQHKHLRDLEAIRNELKGKATELDILKNTITNEQKKSREFQWALEKTKVEHSDKREKEEIEDLKSSFDNERQKNIELSNLLELERELSNDLQKKIESQETLNAVQLSEEHSCNSELQVLLESERLKVLELCSALEREKDLRTQLQMIEQTKRDGSSSEELFRDLQKQLDEKHNHIVLMVNELEENKLECVKLKQQMEKERQIQRKTLQAEQDANILAQKKIHELESRVEDLQWQLEEERQQVVQLLGNEKKQQEMVEGLQQKMQRKEVGLQVEKVASDESNERTRKWIFQQKMGQAETKELSYSSLMGIGGGGGGDASRQSQELEMVRQKLKNVFSKLKHLANKAACRLSFEKSDDEDLIGIQTDIEEVLLKLQVLSDLYSLEINSDSPSSASLTERLLKQNAELTGFVSRLSEEKNNMRNTVMKLEEELRRYQYTGSCGDSTFRQSLHNGRNVDALIASEKEIWHKEKLSLQQSLKQAEAELAKLKAELRNEAFLRELGSDSENAALKRVYGRYLRAESFRKSLIYQKKYLLLLLGGFQECEEATLTLIARMGGQPSYTQLEVITHHSKSFTRFRSAARVLIAISRMKFLVRRWKRVTAYHLIGINRDSYSQNTGNELRSDSFSGSLELCGEHRAASYRSRSELESLRSPFSYQHRYQGIHTDFSPVSLACSQLQNYDPDRALTDYINRLESLQRRLGIVQPASASQTQLHSALRR
uniref:A-kinase anchoring protein 9 n=1 Tax=Naja naja TaxID=35670 RepID=A0A8C6YFI2_NAJNA